MTANGSEYAMDVFRSESIVRELRSQYPTIATLLDYNRSGTVSFLHANGAIRLGTFQHTFSVGHSGYNDGVKVWSEFHSKIETFVDDLIAEVATRYREELNPARITLSKHIHDEYFKVLPYWPDVEETNRANVNINITGSYRCSNFQVVWSCIGVMAVTDKRPTDNEFQAHFTGNPVIKVAFIDFDKIRELENLLNTRSIEEAKVEIDKKRNSNYLTWESLK